MVGKKSARRLRRDGKPRVRVQTSKHGRELIIDETFASFDRQGEVATGSVWDAIAAPLLALPPAQRKRVLLLGLGGGSVARIVRALAPEALIVGVEFDPEVVAIARSHFGLAALDIEVIVADALEVLRTERRRFDFVVDDVFVGRGDGVHKPAWVPRPGHTLAARRLRRGGLFVSNTLDEARRVGADLRARFPGLLRIEVDDYDNRIFVAGPNFLDARALRRAVSDDPVLGESVGMLRFRNAHGARSLRANLQPGTGSPSD